MNKKVVLSLVAVCFCCSAGMAQYWGPYGFNPTDDAAMRITGPVDKEMRSKAEEIRKKEEANRMKEQANAQAMLNRQVALAIEGGNPVRLNIDARMTSFPPFALKAAKWSKKFSYPVWRMGSYFVFNTADWNAIKDGTNMDDTNIGQTLIIEGKTQKYSLAHEKAKSAKVSGKGYVAVPVVKLPSTVK